MPLHADPTRRPGALMVRLFARVVALVVALAVAAAVVVVLVLPRAVQGEAMTVLTGSMSPAIPTGSVALVRPVDPRTVEVGDVVTYQARSGEEVFITHRVIEIRERRGQTLYVLQGDANPIADDAILGDRIRGEVWFHVPYLGAVRDALHGRGGVTLLATLLLAWYAGSQIAAGLRERRGSRRSTTTDRHVVLALLPADRTPEVVVLGGLVISAGTERSLVLLTAPPEGLEPLLDRLAGWGAGPVELLAPGDEVGLGDARTADLTGRCHGARV